MKNILLLLICLCIASPAYGESNLTLKYFKSFERINFPSEPTRNQTADQLMSMEFLNDTTLISVYLSFIMKTNIKTGEYKILMNEQHPFFRYNEIGPMFRNISKWKNLCAVSVYSNFFERVMGAFIYGADGFVKTIFYDEIYQKYTTSYPGDTIDKIYDCKLGADGKLYLGFGTTSKQLRILMSSDTGKTWVRGKDMIRRTFQRIDGFDIVNILKSGDMEVSFFLENLYTLGKKDEWVCRSTDFGNTWDTTNVHRFTMYNTVRTYFPIKSYLSGDTTYMFTQTAINKDSVRVDFARSLNYGESVDVLRSLKYHIHVLDKLNASPMAIVYHPYRIMMSSDDGIYITRNTGRTWTLYIDQIIRHFGTFAMLDDYKGCVHTSDGEYYIFKLETDMCGQEGVEYSNFNSIDGLTLKGDATKLGDSIQLTASKANQSGGAWIGHAMDLDKRFECTFTYSMNEGSDAGQSDVYTPRGADGVTLIISPDAPGDGKSFGMGLGYSTLYRGIAIELDSYVNEAQSDPQFDHIAVFASDAPIVNNHSAKTCLTTKKFEPKFEPNSTKYTITVDNYSYDTELRVYLNKTSYADTPIVRIPNFKIAKYLDANGRGFIGLTSATGLAYENHLLTMLKVCFEDRSKPVGVEENYIEESASESSIYPNPSKGEVTIKVKPEMIGKDISASVFDVTGRCILSRSFSSFEASADLKLNIGSLTAGPYIMMLNYNGAIDRIPLIKY